MDDDVRAAIAASHLRHLPAEVLGEVMADARGIQVPAGAILHREGDTDAHVELVVSGAVRVFVSAPDGRTLTVRYCRPGALMGVVSLFAKGFVMPATTQALVATRLLRMPAPAVRAAAGSDPRVADALLGELSERVLRFVDEIRGGAFASVRQRVARHLLDLASERAAAQRPGPELVARISQRELAAAVGTVREVVVVRILRELRRDGVVRTGRDQIVIVDPARLIQEHGWNTGP